MDATEFGSFVAARRKDLGLTQGDLAARLLVTDKAVSRWERGLGFPDIGTLEPLAAALQVSISELLQGRQAEALPDAGQQQTEQIVSDVLALARQQRQRERRAAGRIIVIALLAVMALFLFSEMHMLLFVFVFVPVLCFTLGIAFLSYGFWLRGRSETNGRWLIYGGLFLLVPVCVMLFFFIVGALGIGPVPD